MLESTPAKVSAGFLVIGLIMSVAAVWAQYKQLKLGTTLLMTFLILLFNAPFILLAIYDVNCIVQGQCDVYAWVKTVFIGLYAIAAVIMFVVVMTQKPSAVVTDESKKETSST
jgi:hypothetical protein